MNPSSVRKPKAVPPPLNIPLYHGTSADQFRHGRGTELYLTDDLEMATTYAVDKFEEDSTAPRIYVVAPTMVRTLDEGKEGITLHPDADFTGAKSWRVSLRTHHSVVAKGDMDALKRGMDWLDNQATQNALMQETKRRGLTLATVSTTSLNYALCEHEAATGVSKRHIRKLTDKGLKLSGGIDTPSLCGRVKTGWDRALSVEDWPVEQTCPQCRVAYLVARGAGGKTNNYPLAPNSGLTDADVKIGMPATIHIGSDSYASEVAAVTPKTITCLLHNERLRFSRRKSGVWTAKRSYRLFVGEAVDHKDPSF